MPQLLLDAIAILMLLRIPAALLCLFKAGLAMGGGFNTSHIFDGPFGKWMGWAIVFITIPELLTWLSGVGLDISAINGSIQTSWLSTAEGALETFVRQVIIQNLGFALAAWFVTRAAFHVVHGESPIPSMLASFALLSVNSIYTLLQSLHRAGDQFASSDMMLSLWQFFASQLAPVGAGAAAIGICWSIAHKRPWLRLAGGGLLFLCLFGLWALTRQWLGIS